jgi:uncharacterized membrane protein
MLDRMFRQLFLNTSDDSEESARLQQTDQIADRGMSGATMAKAALLGLVIVLAAVVVDARVRRAREQGPSVGYGSSSCPEGRSSPQRC